MKATLRVSDFILEIDPRLGTPPPIVDEEKIYGTKPDKISMEDLCGPPIQCPECEKEQKCRSEYEVSLINLISRWEIRNYGDMTYSGFPNRTTGTNFSANSSLYMSFFSNLKLKPESSGIQEQN